MSSGKSTIMSEYSHAFGTDEFTAPPIKVTHEGLDFQFLDAIAAKIDGDFKFNYYELDAPTVQKWHQFIEIADAVIIVYNHAPHKVYGNHENLADKIFAHIKTDAHLFFVANNSSDTQKSKDAVTKIYRLDERNDRKMTILALTTGEEYFDTQYGRRVKLNLDELENIFKTIMNALSK